MSLVADLRALSELFSEPSRRTTGVYARDASGRSVEPQDPRAVCYCLIGGVISVTEGIDSLRCHHLRESLRKALPESAGFSLAGFNDVAHHSQVLEVIALALAKELEGA